MSFLVPASFFLAALALPIVLFYMLKLRRREVTISSTMLWQQLLKDRQANTPWQRLKRNLLLILQLAILAALILSLAQPYLPLPTIVSGSTVILLDGSASMNATDVSPNRFAAAKEAARDIIRDQAAQARTTILLVGEQPQVLIAEESDKTTLLHALESAQPGQGSADWEAAATIASGAVRSSTEDSQVVLISDGGIPEGSLPGLPVKTRFLSVGAGDDNLAITALAARPGPNGVELFSRVENFSSQFRKATLSLYSHNQLLAAMPVNVEANSSSQFILSDLPAEQAVYQARLSNQAGQQGDLDQLSLDNQAFTIYRPPATARALLLSSNPDGNYFLEQLLNLLPSITAYRSLKESNGAPALPDKGFDLYIFDGIFPEQLPEGNLLIINPPSNELFVVQGTFNPRSGVLIHENPITRYLNWGDIHVAKAQRIQLPNWGDPLISVEGEPLVFVGEQGGRRIAVVAFDLHNSDLPLHVAYPILFASLIDYLNPGGVADLPETINLGDSLVFQVDPGIQRVEVVSPSGKSQILLPDENGIRFAGVTELGLYEVNLGAQTESFQDFFAVNLYDANESDLTPRETIQIGRSSLNSSGQTESGQREIWWVFALLGFGLLILEWWVYHRGQSLSLSFWKTLRGRVSGLRSN